MQAQTMPSWISKLGWVWLEEWKVEEREKGQREGRINRKREEDAAKREKRQRKGRKGAGWSYRRQNQFVIPPTKRREG